ncbi:MAG: DNA mismatch repair endonuclease MutL [Bacteroidaceae bacterium]|jgi:DNA mismatch repair protein MutL
MSDIIRLLPDSVANQIAAGEVIQRPASVIKELVENSIDAGATEIDILLLDAGRTLIQVIDNGKGMSQTDARLSFERHATSKIHQADDLFALTTMGFRGEALASIAAVAQVELQTRTPDEEVGTLIELAASKVVRQEVVSCPQGANFSVKNLFYNVPARRKFLKSNHTEMGHILAEFQRIVLVHPDISFRMLSNEEELFRLPPVNLRQRILQLFGKRLNQQLLPVEAETSLVSVKGFIGKPDSAKKKGAQTYFFANNRFMRHPYFHKAVMEAYNHLIPEGEQVPYFLYLMVPPSDIDVNIHPTKTEIKFENEVPIWQILLAAVKEALGKYELVPTIDFDTADKPDIPALQTPDFSRGPVHEPVVSFDPSYNPFQTSGSHAGKSVPKNWEKLYEAPSSKGGADLPVGGQIIPSRMTLEATSFPDDLPQDEPESQTSLFASSASASTHASAPEPGYKPFQLKGHYVLVSVKSGLMLIDQRRAHIRILFNRYIVQLANRQSNGQRLLFPEIVELSPEEEAALKAILPDLSGLGFDIAPMGGGSYAVHAVPAETDGAISAPPSRLVPDLIHVSMERGASLQHGVQYELALTLARSSALVYGQALSAEEMTHLVDALFQCPDCNYTPDGRPVFVILREEELERMFR